MTEDTKSEKYHFNNKVIKSPGFKVTICNDPKQIYLPEHKVTISVNTRTKEYATQVVNEQTKHIKKMWKDAGYETDVDVVYKIENITIRDYGFNITICDVIDCEKNHWTKQGAEKHFKSLMDDKNDDELEEIEE